MPGPIPYSLDKAVPWNYGVDVYYHSVKQDMLAIKDKIAKNVDSDIFNIAGTRKITISGRVFSPEVSPPKTVTGPVIIPVVVPPKTTTAIPVITHVDPPITESAETRGKVIFIEPVQTKAYSESIPEASKKEME